MYSGDVGVARRSAKVDHDIADAAETDAGSALVIAAGSSVPCCILGRKCAGGDEAEADERLAANEYRAVLGLTRAQELVRKQKIGRMP